MSSVVSRRANHTVDGQTMPVVTHHPKELDERNSESDLQKEEATKRQSDVDEKLTSLMAEDDTYAYGLSRPALLNKEWHESNPKAAKHLRWMLHRK